MPVTIHGSQELHSVGSRPIQAAKSVQLTSITHCVRGILPEAKRGTTIDLTIRDKQEI